MWSFSLENSGESVISPRLGLHSVHLTALTGRPLNTWACTVLGPEVTAGDTVTAQSSGGSGSYSSVPEEGPEKQRALLAQSQGANLVPLQQYLLSISPGPVPGAGVPTPEAPIGSHL